eukprot:TRINITY_DN67559_c6_g7_i2.p1 TRINITY_DN67559_c6_g7~~TRINITY_DN67559_c6_g7_i2.p1  ORF type:complete len:595 (-),score=33.54 TRINITY_DN67559_c6_g7_i2:35-1735(-)
MSQTGSREPWKKRDKIWYPVVPDIDVLDVKHLGFCVSECPQGPNFKIDLQLQSSTWYDDLKSTVPAITSYAVNGSAGRVTWLVLYNSTEFLHRCLPVDDVEGLGEKLAESITDFGPVIDVTDWLFGEFAQVASAWKVILICGGCAFLVSFIWIFLLRWFVKPVVYLMLILVLAVLVGGGVWLWLYSIEVKDEKALDQPNWHIGFKAAAIVCWVLALLYLLLLIFLWKSIRIGINLIKCAAKVLTEVYTLIVVPLVFFLLVAGLAALTLAVGAYLQSSGDLEVETINLPDFIIDTQKAEDKANSIQTQIVEDDRAKDWLTLYDIFAFLWGLAFLNSLAYMIISFVAVFWYFSAVGDSKSTPPGAVLKATWWSFRYHLGTLATGALIIAIIQFIRFLLHRLEKQLQKVHDNPAKCAIKCCICYVDCCLACFERVINIVNRIAFVVTAIEGKGFCRSAVRGFRLLIDNIGRIATVSVLSDWIVWFSKLLITAGVVFLGWVLITKTSLADEADAVFPLVVIGVVTYIIASIILHVFGTIVDTLVICFCRDVEMNNGHDKPYYMTSALKRV